MPLPYVNRLENQLRLDGRMSILHWARFRPTDAQNMTFAWWCISVCAYAVVMALGLDAFRFLPSCLAVPIGVDIIRWWYRFGAGQWYVPRLRFLAAPWTFLLIITIVLPMIAHSIHFAAWWGVVIALAIWRLIRVGQKVRTHYLDYVLEHASISVDARTKWTALRETDWRDGGTDPIPSQDLDTEVRKRNFLNAVLALRGQGRSEVLYAIAAAAVTALSMKIVNDLGYVKFRENGSIVLIAVCITNIGILSVLMFRPSGCSFKELWDATWHALHVFCESPPSVPSGSRAPWSERSRYGDAANRQAYLVWNMVAITLLVLSATVFHPLIAEPLRDLRLGGRGREASELEICFGVPAGWGIEQLDAMNRAIHGAGIRTDSQAIRFKTEPAAGCRSIIHEYGCKVKDQDVVFVIDFGGGTFDMTFLQVKRDEFHEYSAPTGDQSLGGRNFTAAIAMLIVEQLSAECGAAFSLESAFCLQNLATDSEREIALSIWQEAEQIKLRLSTASQACGFVQTSQGKREVNVDLASAQQAWAPLWERLEREIDSAIKDTRCVQHAHVSVYKYLNGEPSTLKTIEAIVSHPSVPILEDM